LRDLWLVNNLVTVLGVRAFAKALEENSTLSRLGLTADVLRSEGAVEEDSLKALQRSHTMRKALKCVTEGQEQLNIAGSELNEKGIFRLAKAIQRSGTLSDLRLDGCAISDEGAAILAEALEENTSIAQVSLVNNQIGDAGATRLAAVLKRNNTLENMDLDGNPISDDVSSVISTARLTTPRTWSARSHSGKLKVDSGVGRGPNSAASLDISKMNAGAFKAMSAAARPSALPEENDGGRSHGQSLGPLFPGEHHVAHRRALAMEVVGAEVPRTFAGKAQAEAQMEESHSEEWQEEVEWGATQEEEWQEEEHQHYEEGEEEENVEDELPPFEDIDAERMRNAVLSQAETSRRRAPRRASLASIGEDQGEEASASRAPRRPNDSGDLDFEADAEQPLDAVANGPRSAAREGPPAAAFQPPPRRAAKASGKADKAENVEVDIDFSRMGAALDSTVKMRGSAPLSARRR